MDLNLFTLIAASGLPMSPKELASSSGAETELFARLLRLLSAVGFVQGAEESLYSPKLATKAMASPTIQSGYRFV
jgi:DNA-binding IclR family transcriptional regulator